MSVTIEIPDELSEALISQAHANGVSPDCYVRSVLEVTLKNQTKIQASNQPFESGYGMWAKYGMTLSGEEIDENRQEMFRNFAREF